MDCKAIPFNIWDDYYDDGFAPEGEKQETYGYVEFYDDDDDNLEDDKKKIALLIYEYLKTLDLAGVEVEVETAGEEIYFTNLTHVRREQLVKELRASNLTYQGKPFQFYSES